VLEGRKRVAPLTVDRSIHRSHLSCAEGSDEQRSSLKGGIRFSEAQRFRCQVMCSISPPYLLWKLQAAEKAGALRRNDIAGVCEQIIG
jgi:hypothetical protein